MEMTLVKSLHNIIFFNIFSDFFIMKGGGGKAEGGGEGAGREGGGAARLSHQPSAPAQHRWVSSRLSILPHRK
jgi:hypothetical protein